MLKDMKDPGDVRRATMVAGQVADYFDRKIAVMTENIEELARQVEDLKKRIK